MKRLVLALVLILGCSGIVVGSDEGTLGGVAYTDGELKSVEAHWRQSVSETFFRNRIYGCFTACHRRDDLNIIIYGYCWGATSTGEAYENAKAAMLKYGDCHRTPIVLRAKGGK